MARFLHDNPGAAVCVEGYADATSGSEAYNRELAGQRAEYVKKQLVDKYGYDGSFRYYLRYLGVRADFRLSLLNLIIGCER